MPIIKDVSIAANDGAGTSYDLQINSYTHKIAKKPIVLAYPSAATADGAPNIVIIDFGMMQEMFFLSGIIGPNDTPTRDQLRTAARTWWRYINTGAQTGLTKLTIGLVI